MRAVEHAQGPDELAELGQHHARPEWVAAAWVLREYDEVTALGRHGSYDPAWLLTAVCDLLEQDRAPSTGCTSESGSSSSTRPRS